MTSPDVPAELQLTSLGAVAVPVPWASSLQEVSWLAAFPLASGVAALRTSTSDGRMRHVIALGALWIIGCASDARQRQDLVERRALVRAENAKAYRSRDGFQEARWGMTLAEVRALYPEGELSLDGHLRWNGSVATRSAQVDFLFLKGQLAAVNVGFVDVSDQQAGFRDLRDLLNRKWGPPRDEYDEVAYTQELIRVARLSALLSATLGPTGPGAPEKSVAMTMRDLQARSEVNAQADRFESQAQARLQAAQMRGILRSEWQSSETTTALYALQGDQGPVLKITYESRAFGAALQAESQRRVNAARDEMAKDL